MERECSTCGGGVAEHARPRRLLLATSLTAALEALHELAVVRGQPVRRPVDGLLEVRGDALCELVEAARGALPQRAAEVVRCLLVDSALEGDALLRQAMAAPTLAAVGTGLWPESDGVPFPRQLELAVDRASVRGSALAVLVVGLHPADGGPAPGPDARAELVERLRAGLRPNDRAAAHGDVLAVLVDDLDPLDAERIAGRVAAGVGEALRRPVVHDGLATSVAPAVGIAVFPRHGWTAADLLVAAASAQLGATPHGPPVVAED